MPNGRGRGSHEFAQSRAKFRSRSSAMKYGTVVTFYTLLLGIIGLGASAQETLRFTLNELTRVELTPGSNSLDLKLPAGLNSSDTLVLDVSFAPGQGKQAFYEQLWIVAMYSAQNLDITLNNKTRSGKMTLCFSEMPDYSSLMVVAHAKEQVAINFRLKPENIRLDFNGYRRDLVTANSPLTFLVDPVAGIDASRNDRFLLLVEDAGGQDSANVCMIVAAYSVSCPFKDRPDRVRGAEMWLTMLKKGAMTIRSETHNFHMPFYISLVVVDDAACRLAGEEYPSPKLRSKRVSVTIKRAKPYRTYLLPIVGALIFCVLTLGLAILVMLLKTYGRDQLDVELKAKTPNSSSQTYGTPKGGEQSPEPRNVSDGEEGGRDVTDAREDGPQSEPQPDSLKPILKAPGRSLEDGGDGESSSEREAAIEDLKRRCADALPEGSSRKPRVDLGLNRLKKSTRLSDMSQILKEDAWFRRNRSRVYCYLVPLLSIFYFIPSIQFVFLVKQSENLTGTQDLCFHNFECSKPLNIFSDFNHVISNISYILFGFGFIFCVWLKSKRLPVSQNPKNDHNSETGIMQQLSIFYAMGFAVVFQGFFSVCYHVCPTNYSLQFDSTMMYVMLMLGSVKLYQFRHPDATANAYGFFYVLSGILVAEALTLYVTSWWLYLLFIFFYIGMTFFIAIDCYYHGVGRLHHRIGFVIARDQVLGFFKQPRVLFWRRFILAAIFITLNCMHAIYAVYAKFRKPRKSVTQVVLVILAGNLFLYIAYYAVRKSFPRMRLYWRRCRRNESATDEVDAKYAKYYLDSPCGKQCPVIFSAGAIFATLAIVLGIIAFCFYVDRSANRNLSPAESRALNEPCAFLDFYDNHDIWHFASAGAIFMAFLALLTLDDDYIARPRDEIEVY